MTKFRCIKGNVDVPVGTIIEGELQDKTIVLTRKSDVLDKKHKPYFDKGETVPLTGYVWQWESCEGEPDREELLERFEDAVDVLSSYERDIYHFGKSEIDYVEANKEYEAAREELLKRLS